MESQPRNPEFRNNCENFHPCLCLFLWYHRLICDFVISWYYVFMPPLNVAAVSSKVMVLLLQVFFVYSNFRCVCVVSSVFGS